MPSAMMLIVEAVAPTLTTAKVSPPVNPWQASTQFCRAKAVASTTTGRRPGRADHPQILLHEVLLGGDQQDLDLPGDRVLPEPRVVDEHVVPARRGDQLPRLPLDLLRERGRLELRHADPLDDHPVAGHGQGDLLAAQADAAVNVAQRRDHRGGFDHGAGRDRCGRHRLDAEVLEHRGRHGRSGAARA
jgi:hypothetical protein